MRCIALLVAGVLLVGCGSAVAVSTSMGSPVPMIDRWRVVEEVRAPVTGSVVLDELPTSVEAVYKMLLDGDHQATSYDLVHGAPRSIRLADGSYMVVKVDTGGYPPSIEDAVEQVEEGTAGG